MWSSYLIFFFYHFIKDFISNWRCSAKETAPWKEPHKGPSILMRIVWSMVSSPNFICSTDIFLFIQEKPRSQMAVLLLIVIIILRKLVTPLILPSLWQTNSLYTSIIGLYLDFENFSRKNDQCFFDITYFFENMKVNTCIQERENTEKVLKVSLFLIYFSMHFLYEYKKKLSN